MSEQTESETIVPSLMESIINQTRIITTPIFDFFDQSPSKSIIYSIMFLFSICMVVTFFL